MRHLADTSNYQSPPRPHSSTRFRQVTEMKSSSQGKMTGEWRRYDFMASLMPTPCLGTLWSTYSIPPTLGSFMGNLSFELVRTFLLFLTNLICFCFLQNPDSLCPLCNTRMFSRHFFLCEDFLPFEEEHIPWGALVLHGIPRTSMVERYCKCVQTYSQLVTDCSNISWGFWRSCRWMLSGTRIDEWRE
jgi:hypothetical protein